MPLSQQLCYVNEGLSSVFVGWAVRGGILSQGSMANFWDGREDAEPRCFAVPVLTNPGGPSETGNVLQPAQHWEFQVNSKFGCSTNMLWFLPWWGTGTICLIIHIVFLTNQWHRLDRVFEQWWQLGRHSESPERRRHEGCTTSLAQIWGDSPTSQWNLNFGRENVITMCCLFDNRDRLLQILMSTNSELF